MATTKVSLMLSALGALSFGVLVAKGWAQHRRCSVALTSLLGMTSITLGSLMCGPTCLLNCSNRDTSILLSVGGGLVLAATVVENANLIRERRERGPRHRHRK
jgi:hypothetical protein